MPKYAFAFMVFMLASVGLPGTAGFVGEFMVLLGVFQVNTWVALIAASGVILGAAYMLYLYRRVVFGELTKDDVKAMLDLEPREIVTLAPIVVVTMWMGIYPESFLGIMDRSVADLIAAYNTALKTSVAEVAPLGSQLLAFLR